MFTLATLDTESHQEEGAWLHLTYPASTKKAYIDEKETKAVRIKMRGFLSNTGKESIARKRNEASKAMLEAVKQGKDAAQPEYKEETLETYEENKIKDARELSDLAVDWENMLDHDGNPVKFSKEAMFNALCNAHDLRRQCRDFVSDQAAFTPA